MRRVMWLMVLLTAPAGLSPAVAAAQMPRDTTPAFWRSLGDSTLDRLLAEALASSLDLRAAEARVRGARASRLHATLDLFPAVTAEGGFVRQRLPRVAVPGTGSLPDQSIWDGGVVASWEVDRFGRLRHGLSASGALVSAAGEDLRATQVSLVAELARAYFELRGGQELLGVARRNAANQRTTLEVTRQRLEAGRGTAFDTERALALLSFTEASIPALEAGVASARHRIAVLLGRSPGALVRELSDSVALPVFPEVVEIGNVDSVIASRPDVAAAERRSAAEHALVGAAKADYLPRIGVAATAGYSSSTFEGLGGSGTFRYAVGPGISWPLLNLGRVKAGVDASRARADEAKDRHGQAVLLAREELENALVRYRSARERVDRVEEAAAASRRAAELARLRYGEGVADFLQVLDAERTLLDAESQLSAGRTAAAVAYAAVYQALGGRS